MSPLNAPLRDVHERDLRGKTFPLLKTQHHLKIADQKIRLEVLIDQLNSNSHRATAQLLAETSNNMYHHCKPHARNLQGKGITTQ